MILSQDDNNLPEWVKSRMTMLCPHCKSPIASNHDKGPLTERWCSNPRCPEHMGYRIAYIAKYYNIKGIGPAAGREYFQNHQPSTVVAVVEDWFDEKPTESLSTIADLACIKDFGVTTGKKFLDKYSSFEEYFEKEQFPDTTLLAHKEELFEAEKYFNVKAPFVGKNIFVMATGVIHGYSNRDKYFQDLNLLVGDKIHIIQTGLRKTGVTCLVKEPDAVDHRKSRVAKECGIPILTSEQFTHMIFDAYTNLGGNIDERRKLYSADSGV